MSNIIFFKFTSKVTCFRLNYFKLNILMFCNVKLNNSSPVDCIQFNLT